MPSDEGAGQPGLIAFTLALAGLLDLALAAGLMLYPASGALGLPPADAPFLPRLAAGPLAGLGVAQLASVTRPSPAITWGAAVAKLVSVATIAAHVAAPGAPITARGTAVLWALAAVLGGIALLLMMSGPTGVRQRRW
jgi:hypothetical protein